MPVLLSLATGCPNDVGTDPSTTATAKSTTGPTAQTSTAGSTEPTTTVGVDTTTENDSTSAEGTSSTSVGASTTTGSTSTTGDTSTTTGDTVEDTSSTTADASGGPALFRVDVEVVGLFEDDAILTLNGGALLMIASEGQYAFEPQLHDGEPFTVEFAQSPADHDCAVDPPAGVIAGADLVVVVTCAPKTTLILSEIGFGYGYVSHSFWIELVNVGSKAVELAEFHLRARSVDAELGTYVGMQDYDLPSRLVWPGQRILLRGKTASVVEGPSLIPLLAGSASRPYYHTFGAVELLKGEQSCDYVVFGEVPGDQAAAHAPSDPSAWPGYPAGTAARPVHDLAVLGKSIARDLAETDTNTAADWKIVEFSTPGGPNDTHGCTLDADADGLPDCSEAEGHSYAGVDIYGLGARTGQRDIFLEIDYMDPKGGDGLTVDPGMVPYKSVLDRVVQVFAAHGFALHLDVGDLFDQSPGLDLAQHDRAGGNTVPFATSVYFGDKPGFENFYAIKAHNMAIDRIAMFHYVLFANKGTQSGFSGQAERPGNDLYLSLGGHQYSLDNPTQTNRTLSIQALVFMHELGHNLGLSHGGYSKAAGDDLADEANYKPNYHSVMNYLNSGRGLPTIGVQEGDRYYYAHAAKPMSGCSTMGVTPLNMTASIYGGLTEINLDYSHGLGADIVLDAIDETKGLAQPGSQWVDFNCNDEVDPLYPHDLYTVVEADPSLEHPVLRDHDDWGNLDLYFVKSYHKGFNNAAGARSGSRPPVLVRAPIVDDVQPLDAPDVFPLPSPR